MNAAVGYPWCNTIVRYRACREHFDYGRDLVGTLIDLPTQTR